MTEPVTLDEVRRWPPLVSLTQAARALSIGRNTIYGLAARGELPVPVVMVGTRHRVRTADLIAFLEAGGGQS